MTAYTIQFLKNKITDRINTNHSRSLSGMDVQEMLLDIIDSLVAAITGEIIPGAGVSTSAIPRDTFPEFYGTLFDPSPQYFSYLSEYYLPELTSVTGLLLRVIAPGAGEAGVGFQIRVTSDTNEYLGLYNATLTSELQLLEFTLATPATFECIMVQYKSTIPLYLKEILLINNPIETP